MLVKFLLEISLKINGRIETGTCKVNIY